MARSALLVMGAGMALVLQSPRALAFQPPAVVVADTGSGGASTEGGTSPQGSSSGPTTAAPTAEPAGADDVVDPAELGSLDLLRRMEQVHEELDGLRASLSVPEDLAVLEKRLPAQQKRVAREMKSAERALSEARRWFLVADLSYRFTSLRLELQAEKAPFDQFANLAQGVPEQVTAIIAEWESARRALREAQAGPVVIQRVDELIAHAHVVRSEARRVQHTIVRIGDGLEHMDSSIDRILRRIDEGDPARLEHLTESAFESSTVEPAQGSAWERLRANALQQWQLFFSFVKGALGRMVVHLATFVFVGFTLLRTRLREKNEEKWTVLQHHPVAAAVLLGVLFSIFWYPALPASAVICLVSLGLAGCSRIIWDYTGQYRGPAIAILALFFMMSAQVFLFDLPAWDRAVLLVEGIVSVVVYLLLLRGRTEELTHFVRGALRVGLLVTSVGLLAWLVNARQASILLLNASARILVVSLCYRVGFEVACRSLEAFADSSVVRGSFAVAHHRRELLRRGRTLIRWFIIYLWVKAIVAAFGLMGVLRRVIRNVMDAELDVGSLQFTGGNIIALGLGFVIAIFASRSLRFMLEVELMPRTGLRMGTQAAISTGSYYVALGFGLFVALAAGGLELDNLAILVSALGVGIGFGLQNIVQNFVSGLILIFGRPVNVGDRVELNSLVGQVTSIGFRASTVRTFDGAEVIVPNSNLVSEQVINWSLSDDRRRIVIPVGVAYGTDPRRVLEILVEVGQAHPDVLAMPPAEAVMVGFGDSSLNFELRTHTDEGGRWVNIRSDLIVAINEALQAADIEIPFPQRDLHLRSVPETVHFLPDSPVKK